MDQRVGGGALEAHEVRIGQRGEVLADPPNRPREPGRDCRRGGAGHREVVAGDSDTGHRLAGRHVPAPARQHRHVVASVDEPLSGLVDVAAGPAGAGIGVKVVSGDKEAHGSTTAVTDICSAAAVDPDDIWAYDADLRGNDNSVR